MKKILIVEDNKQNLLYLQEIIRREISGVAIYTAEDQAGAYLHAMNNNITLFLVDIVLDKSRVYDVSGIRFVERIRDMPRYKHVPVIFVTQLEDEQMNAFHRLHCYDYIEKPFDEKMVLKIVREALEFPLANNEEVRTFHYRKEGVLYWLDYDEIDCFIIRNRKLTIRTVDDEISLPYRSCKELLSELPEQFVQCRRDAIVNRSHFFALDVSNRYIILKNGCRVEVGRGFVNSLRG